MATKWVESCVVPCCRSSWLFLPFHHGFISWTCLHSCQFHFGCHFCLTREWDISAGLAFWCSILEFCFGENSKNTKIHIYIWKCKNLNNLYFKPFLSIYISIKKLHMVKERSSHHASQLNPSNISYTYGVFGPRVPFPIHKRTRMKGKRKKKNEKGSS